MLSMQLGGLMHDGYEFNVFQPIDTSNQCAYSDAWGHGFWFHTIRPELIITTTSMFPMSTNFFILNVPKNLPVRHKLASRFLQMRM